MFPCQLGGVGIGDGQPHWNLQEIRDLERRLAESERRNDRLEACRCVLHCWAKYTEFFPSANHI